MIDAVVGTRDSFTKGLAKQLKAEAVFLGQRVFSDGELCPRVLGDVKGKRVLVATRLTGGEKFAPNDYLVESLLIVMNLRRMGAKGIAMLMPYHVYARQDQVFRDGEPHSARHVMQLLKKAGVEKFFTVASHLHRKQGKITFYPPLKAWCFSPFPLIGKWLRKRYKLRKPLVIGPDFNSGGWAHEVMRVIGGKAGALRKKRNLATGKAVTYGDLPDLNGRDVVIVDDIAASGGTLVNAIKMVRKRGARKVVCVVAHAVLTNKCLQRMKKMRVPLFACDTIRSPVSKIVIEKELGQFIAKRA